MTIAEWYEKVNAAWPAPVPPLTAHEAIRAGKRLYRYARGHTWTGPTRITSGRRYTWIQGGTMVLNPEHGWKGLVHLLSHKFHSVLYPDDKPHSRSHARLELRMVKEVVKRGWLDGRLKPQNDAEKLARAEALVAYRNSTQGRLDKIDAAHKRWQSKLKRATTALKKLNRRRAALVRRDRLVREKANDEQKQTEPSEMNFRMTDVDRREQQQDC
jgi:hypothetical protein